GRGARRAYACTGPLQGERLDQPLSPPGNKSQTFACKTTTRGPGPRVRLTGMRRLLRQNADDVVQRAADAAGESGEDRDGADRDHCQDDAVLGHRLALLALPVRPHELEPLIECHSTYLLVGFPARRPASPPSPCSPRKERATAWADPSSDSSEASAGL